MGTVTGVAVPGRDAASAILAGVAATVVVEVTVVQRESLASRGVHSPNRVLSKTLEVQITDATNETCKR